MPPVNQAALASAGIIAASVAVAAAVAIYESPEVRRVADDLRRRIAIALRSLGDNVDPNTPRFNRPEDAEGFLQSRGVFGGDDGVDADDETRRRQREELMYWNALREEKREKERQEAAQHTRAGSRSSSFDDFLEQDKSAERGTFVFNTGADVRGNDQNLIRRRGGLDGVRGLNASIIANPFSDEYGIELDENLAVDTKLMSPDHDETMSDIYDATPLQARSPEMSHTLSPQSKPVVPDVLFDFDSQVKSESATVEGDEVASTTHTRSMTLEEELAEDEYMTAGQEDRQDAYASIQAWAQGSGSGFYSPLPESPRAPMSEAELISEGGFSTPTDSVSLAGSGEDIANDAASSKAGDFDAVSEEGDGILTPSSWSEVGSVVSESDSNGLRL